MRNLKRRFRWFNRALRLYPRAYYRQYAVQTLQTLADLLDEPGLSLAARLRIRTKAWLDLLRSIPRQRLNATARQLQRRPAQWLRRRIFSSLILAAPLLVTLSVSHFTEPSAVNIGFWANRFVIDTWAIVMPMLATGLAMYSCLAWFLTRQPGAKRNLRSIVWLSVGLVVSIAGIGFLGVAGIKTYANQRRDAHNTQLSLQYQKSHPTMACNLLPPIAAQLAMGDVQVTMNNAYVSASHPYSGIIRQSKDQQETSCSYLPKNYSQYGVTANVYQAFTTPAQQQLHAKFISAYQNPESAITIHGHSGYYTSDAETFGFGLWADNTWLDVTAHNFAEADSALQTMLSNLQQELALQAATATAAKNADAQRRIVPLPVTAQALTADDKTQIGLQLATSDNLPAGTTYSINFATIAGNRVNGTIRYQTGLHGSFTVDKQSSGWTIVSYKHQK